MELRRSWFRASSSRRCLCLRGTEDKRAAQVIKGESNECVKAVEWREGEGGGRVGRVSPVGGGDRAEVEKALSKSSSQASHVSD
jgi:hypothetical protein